MTFAFLLLMFTLLPLVEFMLLLWINQQTGICFTLAFVLGTGMLGAALAKWQGFSIWRQIILEVSRGQTPTNSMVDGILTLVAGLLLITPGVITDITGILLLFPPCRFVVRELLKKEFQRRVKIQIATNLKQFDSHFSPQATSAEPMTDSEVFEADYKIITPKKRGRKPKNLGSSPSDPV